MAGRPQERGRNQLHWFPSLLLGVDGALGLMNQLVWGATFPSGSKGFRGRGAGSIATKQVPD